jgi:hypothetical protein
MLRGHAAGQKGHFAAMFESLSDHCAHILATTPSASVSVAVARGDSPIYGVGERRDSH